MGNLTNVTGLDAGKASELRDVVFREMLRTRRHKYKWWLICMRVIRFIAILLGEFKRAEIVLSLYAALHFVDDVVDGDAPLPARYKPAVDYVRRKMCFYARPSVPEDNAEWLLLYARTLAEEIGLSTEEGVQYILASMLFDAERRNPLKPKRLYTRQLHEHFHRLDIVGTVGLCLKIFREVTVTHPDLRDLGEASRIQYTVKDLDEDFRAGYCNIPLEDIISFKITVLNSAARPVKKWSLKEADRGISLLQEHKRKVRGLPLRVLTRIVLPLLYERPARKFFNKVLRDE